MWYVERRKVGNLKWIGLQKPRSLKRMCDYVKYLVAFLLLVTTLLIFHFLQDFERKVNVIVQVFKYNNLHFWGGWQDSHIRNSKGAILFLCSWKFTPSAKLLIFLVSLCLLLLIIQGRWESSSGVMRDQGKTLHILTWLYLLVMAGDLVGLDQY